MKNKEFWITNISNKSVSLGDLGLTIKPYCSINLLDAKHYHYTIDQIEKSCAKGSLYGKRNKIVVRQKAPEDIKNRIPMASDIGIPDRSRSMIEIKHVYYEELNILDEDKDLDHLKFVEANAAVLLDEEEETTKKG